MHRRWLAVDRALIIQPFLFTVSLCKIVRALTVEIMFFFLGGSCLFGFDAIFIRINVLQLHILKACLFCPCDFILYFVAVWRAEESLEINSV